MNAIGVEAGKRFELAARSRTLIISLSSRVLIGT
jgi:hypothetical protein